ncbi:MAG: NAD-dependent epimerase/dehydratase family protein [Acidimicrobiales bacterium]
MATLVTGGAGFIGSHIVDQLIARGDEVIVIDNLDPAAHDGEPDWLNPNAEYLWGNVVDRSTWDAVVGRVSAVCHQASKVGLGVDFADIDAYVSDNDLGMAVGLRSLHDAGWSGRFVLASSRVVYGEGAYTCPIHGSVRPPARLVDDLERGDYEPRCPQCQEFLTPGLVPEEALLDPRNVYAATKLHQEHLLAFVREHPGVSSAALRYHNVYGGRMPSATPYAGVASIFRSSIARGAAPRVFEDGGQRRNFVHVVDVARANVLALTADQGVTGPFNIASQEPATLLDMAQALCAARGEGLTPQVVGGYRLGDVRHVTASTERASKLLGFTAFMRSGGPGHSGLCVAERRRPQGCL